MRQNLPADLVQAYIIENDPEVKAYSEKVTQVEELISKSLGIDIEEIDEGKLKKVTTEYYGKSQKKYLPLVDADINKWKWSAREKEVIDNVIERLSGMDATTISEFSHEDIPWEVTKDKDIIDYDTVFYRKPPFSVRAYPEE